MKKIIVQPLVGFANVTFGMERVKVRKLLDGFQKEFQKSPFDPTKVDDFGYCHIYYDNDDKCEAVEFFTEVEIQINGQKVSPGKVEAIKKITPDLIEDEDGFWISKGSSIGITAPDGTIEAILLGCTNYYC